MAGPGRGEKDAAGAWSGAGERSLFAPPTPVQPVPVPFAPAPMPDPPARTESAAGLPGRRTDGGFGPVLGHGLRRLRALAPVRLRVRAAEAAATELDRGAAFLMVPVCLGLGVIGYFSLAAEPGWLPLVAAAAVLAALALAVRARHHAFLAVTALLVCSLGALAAKVETWRAATPMLGAEVTTRLTGRAVAIETMANGRLRITLDVLSTERPVLRHPPERVRISARRAPPELVPGATVTGLVRLLPPTGPVRPGSYDYSFASYFAGIGASGFFLAGPRVVADAAAPLRLRLASSVERVRDAIARHVRATVGEPEGEIAAALIVGVRAGIPEPINEAMRKIGIYHIISISGLHMALVAGTVMVLLRGALALFPDFASRRPVKKYAAVAALAAISAYLAISGAEVAAERSYLMLAVMLTAVLFDRTALSMRNLAISAILVIALSPHEVVGPSFQMSFAATAALVGAYAGWAEHRAARRRPAAMRRQSLAGTLARRSAAALAGLAATSIVAGGATTLFAVWHFQRVAPLSLFANLAVMPIVSIVVMPFAVLAALAMPFGLDGPFLQVMGQGLTAMIALSEWIAARSPLDAVGLVSTLSVALVTLALAIATMATTWLRVASVPIAVLGLVTIGWVRAPDMLVSEDARLVAVAQGDGALAVNRARANAFTIENWQRALAAGTLVRPDAKAAGAGAGFHCEADLCLARHASGQMAAVARSEAAARPACALAAVIVIEDATASDPCRDPAVLVVTARELARRGSAAVFLAGEGDAAPARIRFGVEKDLRPWHAGRQFSRAARGLAPYVRKTAEPGR